VVVGAWVPSAAYAAPTTDPAKVRCAGVEHAPALPGDRNPDGSPVRPVPDPRGRFVPVIMVHGWTGRSTHTEQRDGTFSSFIDLTALNGTAIRTPRSLIGQLQRIPGAAVFTFDYHDHSACAAPPHRSSCTTAVRPASRPRSTVRRRTTRRTSAPTRTPSSAATSPVTAATRRPCR
jgi:hypothetical protein